MESSVNPIADFFDTLAVSTKVTQHYFESHYKEAFKKLNPGGNWFTRLFRSKKQPTPQVVHDSERRIIMLYWWDEDGGILCPCMKIHYTRKAIDKMEVKYDLITRESLNASNRSPNTN